MSVTIYGPREVAAIRAAGQAAAATLAYVGARLAPGVTTAEIDAWVREDTARRDGRPSQLGYHGFPASVCTSRNAVVCHGVPRADDVLGAGDIINVDVTTELDGYHGDTSMVFTIEPMLTLGAATTRVPADGWTAVTTDGQWSAQFEHTLCVTSEGAEILT